jgi:simple sugar transport system ATP-binding protein
MSVAEYVAASNYDRAGLKRSGYVDQDRIDAFASAKIKEFDVRGAVPDTPIGTLSGGNMQKVVIARELNRDPDLLVICQPTRGLDVGAAEFIYARIMAAADRGRAVLLISSELSEIFALSDRIGVMYSGQLLKIIDRKDADEVKVGALMNGSLEAAA